MAGNVASFYDALAESYPLIFDDWDSAIDRQAAILGDLLAAQCEDNALKILDCACGVGTQALGLAMVGHQVTASDLSKGAVLRERQEARRRGLKISFCVSDMTSLQEVHESGFDAAIAMDNALPHLSAEQLVEAAAAISRKLKPNGLFMASIRDYDTLTVEQPAMQAPAFYGEPGTRRIVHQVWEWTEDSSYALHLFITVESARGWKSLHFVSEYRCLLRHELSAILSEAGFGEVRWIMPSESGFYQPIVLARWPG